MTSQSCLAVQSKPSSRSRRLSTPDLRDALIGGLALLLRGRPRFTQDVDFLMEIPQVVLPGLLDDLVERGFSLDPAVVIKQYVREHVASFPFGRVRVDWLKPVLPLYSHTLANASILEWTEGTRSGSRPPRD